MRNLRKLGLVLMAVMALGAVVASAAQAESQFTATEYPATITGHQEGEVNRLVVGGITVECEVATFHGTLAGASSSLTVTPDYTGCETSLGTEATIDTAGCDYLFHAGAAVEGSNHDSYEGSVDVSCETGKEIRVTAGFCNVDVAAQSINSGITYTNLTNAEPTEDVTVDVNSTVAVKGTNVFLCPSSVTSATTGTYESKVTIQGWTDPTEEKQIGVLVSTSE